LTAPMRLCWAAAIMPAQAVIRDELTRGSSWDITDNKGKRLGRIDLTKLPSGRKLWHKYDTRDVWTGAEGEVLADEQTYAEEPLVEDIWRNR